MLFIPTWFSLVILGFRIWLVSFKVYSFVKLIRPKDILMVQWLLPRFCSILVLLHFYCFKDSSHRSGQFTQIWKYWTSTAAADCRVCFSVLKGSRSAFVSRRCLSIRLWARCYFLPTQRFYSHHPH
jgi:hypothetical protein